MSTAGRAGNFEIFRKNLKFPLQSSQISGIIIRQCQAVKRGHTSRGHSGALYLKSATAGVDSPFEERTFTYEP